MCALLISITEEVKNLERNLNISPLFMNTLSNYIELDKYAEVTSIVVLIVFGFWFSFRAGYTTVRSRRYLDPDRELKKLNSRIQTLKTKAGKRAEIPPDVPSRNA